MKLTKVAIQSLTHNTYFVTTSIISVLALILLIATILISMNLYNLHTAANTLQFEVDDIQTQVDIVKKNKDLIEPRIDEFNTALERLIPDNESYFLVISALEQLENETGISISQYSIDLSATTEEKLTLTVNTTGTASAIDRFLQSYKFISGRLITNELLNITPNELENVAFSLNFYHSAFEPGSVAASTLTEEDIRYVSDIISQL